MQAALPFARMDSLTFCAQANIPCTGSFAFQGIFFQNVPFLARCSLSPCSSDSLSTWEGTISRQHLVATNCLHPRELFHLSLIKKLGSCFRVLQEAAATREPGPRAQGKMNYKEVVFLETFITLKVFILFVLCNKLVREPQNFATEWTLEIIQHAYFTEGKLRLRVYNYSCKTSLDRFSCLLGSLIILPSPLLELGDRETRLQSFQSSLRKKMKNVSYLDNLSQFVSFIGPQQNYPSSTQHIFFN